MEAEEDFNILSAAREATCQVCDLKSLKGLADLASVNAPAARLLAGQTQSMLLHWTQTSRNKNAEAVDLCKQRDGYCCVFTKQPSIQAAYIYPFYSLKMKKDNLFGARHTFWDHGVGRK
ncbi:hypothetical protein V502_07377 [Pseudogymnoascus sp. VKM F-4520 (FW-2644)]|nr:hypothetical protein V502_07377 [Pseudogymnoascus sp. VKM F-4520 (FW-2644)]